MPIDLPEMAVKLTMTIDQLLLPDSNHLKTNCLAAALPILLAIYFTAFANHCLPIFA